MGATSKSIFARRLPFSDMHILTLDDTEEADEHDISAEEQSVCEHECHPDCQELRGDETADAGHKGVELIVFGSTTEGSGTAAGEIPPKRENRLMKMLRSFSSRELACSDSPGTTTSVFSTLTSPSSSKHSESLHRTSSGYRTLYQTAQMRGLHDEELRSEHEEVISPPLSSSHDLHVTFNCDLARFEGLEGAPIEWQNINRQFGVSLQECPKVHVDDYGQIPAVLVMLRKLLVVHGGIETVGIFRLAPDKESCNAAKAQIDNGSFTGETDVNVLANLIKQWFRECPDPLYEDVPQALMSKVCGMEAMSEVHAELGDIPEMSRGLLLWIFDLMSLVVMHEVVNKMSPRNLAIVMSPNFFRVKDSPNPMVALTQIQLVNDFTLKVLLARLMYHHQFVSPSEAGSPTRQAHPTALVCHDARGLEAPQLSR